MYSNRDFVQADGVALVTLGVVDGADSSRNRCHGSIARGAGC